MPQKGKSSSPEHPHKNTHMVSGCDYYRKRADIDRGLKKRDFPAAQDSTPSEKDDEAKIAADKKRRSPWPDVPPAKH